jgi:hypothetical protein
MKGPEWTVLLADLEQVEALSSGGFLYRKFSTAAKFLSLWKREQAPGCE